MTNNTYRVEVVRSGNWWAITVPDLPGTLSQAKRIDQVEANAREAIALMIDGDEENFDLDIRIHTDPAVAELIAELQASTEATTRARADEARTRLGVIRELQKRQLPTRDIGALIGLSH